MCMCIESYTANLYICGKLLQPTDIEGQLEIVKFLLDQLWHLWTCGQMGSVWSMDIYYE